MKTRVLSGLVMLPLLVFVAFGGYVLVGACFLLGLLAVREFFKAFASSAPDKLPETDAKGRPKEGGAGGRHAKARRPAHPSMPVTVICTVFLYAATLFLNTSFIVMWLVLVVTLSLLLMFRQEKHDVRDALLTMAGNVYVIFFLFHVVLIGLFFNIEDGWVTSWFQGMRNPVWLVLLTAFGTDIFAYFAGVTLGRHKLCPKISPKKTVEGSIGGILGSTLLCGLFGHFFLPELFVQCILIGIFGSVFAQLGDLTASVIKRHLGMKDYGKLIPGHGGILDRFDSVLFTAPFVFHWLNIYNSIEILLHQAENLT
ncbi:MAG: phosphatidate cytidylyltransferase [Clostridiales Family XIII bacterium]|jgi:phosphatidate cytidylyltransferase|nr:phosphatidate cytidylyltransferase [Clostridiales Family XIII bacterium]